MKTGITRQLATSDGVREAETEPLHTPAWPKNSNVLFSETIPTVCLDVISLVASSCGYNRGAIEQRVAHEFTAHVTKQRGLVEHPQHRRPPRTQPAAPIRERHCRRPWLPPRRGTAQAPHRAQGHPRWAHTRGAMT